ncbi:Rpn family recombination-promoting nuclease/putative transposase [Desulfonatronovibrio magnus]|uniref:Rpn family recombination-promoting nuclease/putative transposase n=1 Tax=Desulfonatronovibrio magnus TaxID=698827 RepID=UPI0022B71527|nr:Rpn family recombination-promoting nuclease/putative transposase [Desulfonatronovibrio magnus]
MEPTTYVDKKLKKHYSDLVFSVRLVGYKNQFARIYLLFEKKRYLALPGIGTGINLDEIQWMAIDVTGFLPISNGIISFG